MVHLTCSPWLSAALWLGAQDGQADSSSETDVNIGMVSVGGGGHPTADCMMTIEKRVGANYDVGQVLLLCYAPCCKCR